MLADVVGRMGDVELDRSAATRLQVYEQQPNDDPARIGARGRVVSRQTRLVRVLPPLPGIEYVIDAHAKGVKEI